MAKICRNFLESQCNIDFNLLPLGNENKVGTRLWYDHIIYSFCHVASKCPPRFLRLNFHSAQQTIEIFEQWFEVFMKNKDYADHADHAESVLKKTSAQRAKRFFIVTDSARWHLGIFSKESLAVKYIFKVASAPTCRGYEIRCDTLDQAGNSVCQKMFCVLVGSPNQLWLFTRKNEKDSWHKVRVVATRKNQEYSF